MIVSTRYFTLTCTDSPLMRLMYEWRKDERAGQDHDKTELFAL